jgi:hypothetical protein
VTHLDDKVVTGWFIEICEHRCRVRGHSKFGMTMNFRLNRVCDPVNTQIRDLIDGDVNASHVELDFPMTALCKLCQPLGDCVVTVCRNIDGKLTVRKC